jgi:glycosyltransferase involved in cell wall biosynthesis
MKQLHSPLRICFLSALHPPYDKRVFDKEARTLAAAGFDAIHLAPGDGSDRVVDGVRVVTFPGPQGLKQRIGQLRRLYRQAAVLDADVYHCNEVDSWAVGVALRWLRGSACVFDVHEHYPEDFVEMRFPPILHPFVKTMVRMVMWLLARGTDRVVLAKRSLEKDFRHYPKEKAFLVQNFVPLAELPPLGQVKPVAESDRPLRLIHLGLVNRVRGWPQMLEGLARARQQDVELLVLGEIGGGEEDAFHETAKRLGLASRVRHKAWLPFAEAMQEVVSADVGVIMFQPGYFNHVHALPHKLFDYMGGGLPVIAPDFAVEVAHIVGESGCGLLVDSADPQAFADAIDRMASDSASRHVMGVRGRQAVENAYNWEAEGMRLVAMYKEMER